jgi:hypothetical protein
MGASVRNRCVLLAISVALVACSRPRSSELSRSCVKPPATPLAPFSSALAEGLVGDFSFTVIAKSGPRSGKTAHGVLHLLSADTLQRYYVRGFRDEWRRIGNQPLVGWMHLEGDVALSTAGVPLNSRDSVLPGVASRLDSVRSGLRFMLGYRPMLDGGFNEFVITQVSMNEFAGRWSSQMGYTTYKASGYFCAVRRSVIR